MSKSFQANKKITMTQMLDKKILKNVRTISRTSLRGSKSKNLFYLKILLKIFKTNYFSKKKIQAILGFVRPISSFVWISTIFLMLRINRRHYHF